MQQEPPDSGRDTGLAVVYYASGRRAEADGALTRLTQERAGETAYEIAEAHAYRRDLDQAFTWLDRAYRQKKPGALLDEGRSAAENLESDPRYKPFLRKMNR